MEAHTPTAHQAEAGHAIEIREHVPLAPYTTLGIGGPARWFVSASTEAHVQAAVQFARDRGAPLFVLGGGSNLLVSDDGFAGVVLHMAIKGICMEPNAQSGLVHVTAAAGEDWDRLVNLTVDRDLHGMECMAGIPGTVGGTPVQNVGAYGQEVAQTLVSARCFDLKSGQFVELRHADFGFGYRTSLLNGPERGRYIVTRVTFALAPNGAPTLAFPELKRNLGSRPHPSLREVAETVRAIRRGKGMVVDANDPDSRSAGSFFRNPIVPVAHLAHVASVVHLPESEVPHWPAGEGRVKLPAAWLLERAGFVRGTALGRVGISSKHTLAIVNRGNATESDVAALRNRIVDGVRDRFGIQLEQEPVNVGQPLATV